MPVQFTQGLFDPVLKTLIERVFFDRAVVEDPVVLTAPLDCGAEKAAHENRERYRIMQRKEPQGLPLQVERTFDAEA